jgi:hypothetical protein
MQGPAVRYYVEQRGLHGKRIPVKKLLQRVRNIVSGKRDANCLF